MNRYEHIRQGIIAMEQEVAVLGGVVKKRSERKNLKNGRVGKAVFQMTEKRPN